MNTNVNEGNIEPQSSEGCRPCGVFLSLLQLKCFIQKITEVKLLEQLTMLG